MDAEIIASGTELLMGETQDTNSSFLSLRLPSVGLQVRKITIVGDDFEEYSEALRKAWEKSSFVFTTGGLGPTKDDLTREAIANLVNEKPSVDENQLKILRNFFAARNSDMPDTNIKQSWLIPSATAISNPNGTAPGWWVEKNNKFAIALPGPPRELYPMWENEIKPKLISILDNEVVMTRSYKTIGLSEARIDEMASPIIGKENPYVGIYAKEDGIHIRAIAKAKDQDKALDILKNVDDSVEQIFGSYVWGTDDELPEESLLKILISKNKTLGLMESCTAGTIANKITNIDGSSNYFYGGLVSYSDNTKIQFGINEDSVKTFSSISEEVCKEMAIKAREIFNADYGISTTGIAGNQQIDGIIPGTVFIGIADGTDVKISKHLFPSNNRNAVKNRASTMAILSLIDFISESI
ncbi:MAG: CinA family nicotinamide mononucleotide deamidase-related protein [Dehalococcoidia bacterium]